MGKVTQELSTGFTVEELVYKLLMPGISIERKLNLEQQHPRKDRGREGDGDCHRPNCQENSGDPGHRDIRENDKGGSGVTSDKNKSEGKIYKASEKL